eukprot:1144887-Alexandrium_andersonii.AAC.1
MLESAMRPAAPLATLPEEVGRSSPLSPPQQSALVLLLRREVAETFLARGRVHGVVGVGLLE